MEIIILSIILILITGIVVWSVIQNNQRWSDFNSWRQNDKSLDLLQQQVNALTSEVSARLNENAKLLQTTLDGTHKNIGDRLDNAAKVVGEVQNRLGRIEEANLKIYEVGRDIAELQHILKAPKIRGGWGELLLEDILSQMLPKEHYIMQYSFKNGNKVDAVIKLGSSLVPVDAKFPLENFRKYMNSEDDSQKKTARRLFITDVKKHIDAVLKYITPDEGTFDFALMYIPAENVFYETIIRHDNFGEEKSIAEYAVNKKIIPVSPNSFYAYLQSIAFGLRGLRVEQQAQQILKNLQTLKNTFDRFRQDFDKLGTHLNHSRSSYEAADKRLNKFEDKLILASGEQQQTLENPNTVKQIT